MYFCVFVFICLESILCSKSGNAADADTDLKRAAEFGSTLARMAVSNSNPYASICHVAVEHILANAVGHSGPPP